jgi:hypothetical protein
VSFLSRETCHARSDFGIPNNVSATTGNSRGLSKEAATNPQFWRELCPGLTIGGAMPAPTAAVADTAVLLERLRREGYVNEPAVIPRAVVEPLRAALQRLEDAGIPHVFAFVYDEFWQVFRSLEPFLQAVLGPGYRMLPDCWAWYVRPSNQAAGWKPHRDRPATVLDADNTPHSLTVWLPLTDATPLNGCIYVLPAHWDADIRNAATVEPAEFQLAGEALQNIRALTAPAGSLLAWNQLVLHWGGQASERAREPRCSIALQFQRGDREPFATPLLDPRELPPFYSRLGLIGRLLRGYTYFQKLESVELKCLAAALDWSYWREGEKSGRTHVTPT